MTSHNFNKILYKLDKIMNNIPKYVISENINWNYIDSIKSTLGTLLLVLIVVYK